MKDKKEFINLLRVLAAICITNSHFANVWPISGIASGGMLGDVLFFAISGYCLYHSNFRLCDFGRWYIRRIKRIYITVFLIVFLICCFSGFPTTAEGWIRTFIYPTKYHFVASIMVLYIVYYIWMNLLKRWRVQVWISGAVFAVCVVAVYILMYDTSWYHIDNVEDHFIRFLFFVSMLLGAHFREEEQTNKKSANDRVGITGVLCIVSVIIYFGVRMVVPRFELYTVQILTWVAIMFALYWIFRWAESLEPFLLKLPGKVNRIFEFLAGITLQIYLVQFPIIERFETIIFPVNLLIITAVVIGAAAAVYWVDQGIQKGMEKLFYH